MEMQHLITAMLYEVDFFELGQEVHSDLCVD